MAFFDKKVTVESILKDFQRLSDEDKAKVLNELKPVEDTDEQVAEGETDVKEKVEDIKTEEDHNDENKFANDAFGSDKDNQGEEVEEDEEVVDDEAEGEEEAQTEENAEAKGNDVDLSDIENRLTALESKANDDVTEALSQRITALEERLGKVVETLDNKPFGAKPETPTSKDDYADDDDRIMQSYYGRGYRKN